jgi:hypothetical protein
MNQIDIGTVLNKFNDTYDQASMTVKHFGIRFINDRGEKRTILCRKNVKSPKQEKTHAASIASTLSGSIQDKGTEFYNLQRNGVMLVRVESEDHPRSIKTCMIYGFKDFGSDTWLKVFH